MLKNYTKLFSSRSVKAYALVIILFFSCILRLAIISSGNLSEIQTNQSRYRINISNLRGTIYDCNMVPITNSSSDIVAAVLPTPRAVMAISKSIDEDDKVNVFNTMKNKLPLVCDVKNHISAEGIATTNVYNYYDEKLPAAHIIGYIDSSGHGVTGLEQAYDEFLYSDKMVSAVFTTDGKGNVLSGIEPYFENDLSVIHSGVVTTIDVNIQNMVENIATDLNCGCVIVAEANSGKIRAMASFPTFDINNISESFNKENSPMINRALSTYSVGSVFKPIVAACAIENGFLNFSFDCKGSTKIANRTFRCHKWDGHGLTNLHTALSQSCNCFFYNIAISVGGDYIYKQASSLGIASKNFIAKNLSAKVGNLPQKDTLNNEGALANFSIGQGDLLASPVSILNLYTAIATDGSYYVPSIIEKTIKDGEEQIYETGSKTRVMKKETAGVLREYLKSVLTEGTGTEAMPQNCTAAGKTATAQTGRYYDNGVEITNSWFCGFFPADKPKYVIIVMSDGKCDVSTASIFAKIADEIIEYER